MVRGGFPEDPLLHNKLVTGTVSNVRDNPTNGRHNNNSADPDVQEERGAGASDDRERD